MSQKNPKLPQLDIAVHGFGYLEENYGKRNFGFSEIPPEVDISDGICDALSDFISDFLFRKLFVIYFGWYLGFLLYVQCVNCF